MKRQTVVRTLPEALKVIKEINLTSQDEWAGDYRDAARETIARVLKDRMEERVAGHLSWAYGKGFPDRRNGIYPRHVLTELGGSAEALARAMVIHLKTFLFFSSLPYFTLIKCHLSCPASEITKSVFEEPVDNEPLRTKKQCVLCDTRIYHMKDGMAPAGSKKERIIGKNFIDSIRPSPTRMRLIDPLVV